MSRADDISKLFNKLGANPNGYREMYAVHDYLEDDVVVERFDAVPIPAQTASTVALDEPPALFHRRRVIVEPQNRPLRVHAHRAHLQADRAADFLALAQRKFRRTAADVDHAANAAVARADVREHRLLLAGDDLHPRPAGRLASVGESPTVRRVAHRAGGKNKNLLRAVAAGALRQLVNEGILPHADFRTTSRLVLGPFWSQATDAQKAAFMDAFQDMLMRTYADALLSYEDQPIRVKRPTGGYFDWDKAVPTEIVLKDGRPVQVKYYLYRNPQGEWKVYDVVAENVSFIMSYRNVLQEDARRLGLDGLIEKMRTQNIPVKQAHAQ